MGTSLSTSRSNTRFPTVPSAETQLIQTLQSGSTPSKLTSHTKTHKRRVVNILPFIISALLLVFISYVSIGNFQYRFTLNSQDVFYIPSSNVLIASPVRPLSAAFWTWLYTGLTGQDRFTCTEGTAPYPVLNFSSPCWRKLVIPASSVPRQLTRNSKSVLRVAVVPDPYKSLLSIWNAHISCHRSRQDKSTHMDVAALRAGAKQLGGRRVFGELKNVSCMSLEEYADTLNEVPVLELPDLWRPSAYFSKLISYDVILSDADVHNISALRTIWDRLPFKHALSGAPPPWSLYSGDASLGSMGSMSQRVVLLLHRFARRSETISPSLDTNSFFSFKNNV